MHYLKVRGSVQSRLVKDLFNNEKKKKLSCEKGRFP